jgi:hypothetical protein
MEMAPEYRSGPTAQPMSFKPYFSSSALRRASLALGVCVTVLALLSSWKGEDAWSAAGWWLLTLGLGFAVLVLIWLGGFRAGRPLRALRDSAGLGVAVVLAAIVGHRLSQAELRPTRERVELLAAAIAEHQRSQGSLPASVDGIESALPASYAKVYPIQYKPRPDGTFTLYFQPAWYRHEYFPANRSWVKSD